MLYPGLKKEIRRLARKHGVKIAFVRKKAARAGLAKDWLARARFGEEISVIAIYPGFGDLDSKKKMAVLLRELGRLIFKRNRRRKAKLALVLKQKCKRVFFESEEIAGNSLKLILDLAEEAFAQKFAEHYGADPSIVSINSLKSSLSDKSIRLNEGSALRLLRKKLRESEKDFWQSLFALNALLILSSKQKNAKSELMKAFQEDFAKHAEMISNALENKRRFIDIVRECAPFVREELAIIFQQK